MNTKNKQDGKNQLQKTRQQQGSKKQARSRHLAQSELVYHEHERPETRMTR